MTIKQKEKLAIEKFSELRDWNNRYLHLIVLGKQLVNMELEHKTDCNLIKGCNSKVWIHAELINNKIVYSGDSDSAILKGIINLLFIVFSNQTPDAIIKSDTTFITTINLNEFLSANRQNGLISIINQIKNQALKFKTSIK